MRKQSGFTLIELMVVMAIIAILATAGLSAYTGYLKKARDATRLEDIRALETVAISSFDVAGQAVSIANFRVAVSAMNNGVILEDPLGTAACLWEDETIGNTCAYQYFECDNGGYVIRVAFESNSNFHFYSEDKLNSGSFANSDATYDIGNCNIAGAGGTI